MPRKTNPATIMKKNLITFLSLFFAAMAFGAAVDPVVGEWHWFDKRTRIFRADGTCTDGKGVQEAVWKCTESAPGSPRRYMVVYGSGKFVDTLALNEGGAFLDGRNNFSAHVTARRVGGVAAAQPAAPVAPVPVQPAKPAQKADGQDAPGTEYMGMKLHPEWFPKRETKTGELTKDLARISREAVQGREKDHDIMPGKILWDLKWLMPVDDAAKALPGMERSQMSGAAVIITPNWPQRSLFARSYYGKFVEPHTQELFKEAVLISDIKQQLVAVELICNRPPEVKWEPKFNGSKEPYYDFVGMKQNASTRNIVYYQLVKYGGITCMHTLLFEGRWPIGKSLENVRWYVAPPLARKILEITESLSAPQPGK